MASPVENFYLYYDQDPIQFHQVLAEDGMKDGARISMKVAPMATDIQRFVDAHKALASAGTINQCTSALELAAELGHPGLVV